MASKSKVENSVKGHNPQKVLLQLLRDVCKHYQNNPGNNCQDIDRKRNMAWVARRADILLTISLALLRRRGIFYYIPPPREIKGTFLSLITVRGGATWSTPCID